MGSYTKPVRCFIAYGSHKVTSGSRNRAMAPPEEEEASNSTGRRYVNSYKAPPAFADGDNYSDWKMDLELWLEFTSLEKRKQGTALLLELKPGKVKDTVRSLGKEVVTAEDGIAQVTAHLDKIYQEDSALIRNTLDQSRCHSRVTSQSLRSYLLISESTRSLFLTLS